MSEDADAAYEEWREWSYDKLCEGIDALVKRTVEGDDYFQTRPEKTLKAIKSYIDLKLEMMEKNTGGVKNGRKKNSD